MLDPGCSCCGCGIPADAILRVDWSRIGTAGFCFDPRLPGGPHPSSGSFLLYPNGTNDWFSQISHLCDGSPQPQWSTTEPTGLWMEDFCASGCVQLCGLDMICCKTAVVLRFTVCATCPSPFPPGSGVCDPFNGGAVIVSRSPLMLTSSIPQGNECLGDDGIAHLIITRAA